MQLNPRFHKFNLYMNQTKKNQISDQKKLGFITYLAFLISPFLGIFHYFLNRKNYTWKTIIIVCLVLLLIPLIFGFSTELFDKIKNDILFFISTR